MNVDHFYTTIGESYSNMLSRIPSPKTIENVVRLFLTDNKFQTIKDGIEEGDLHKAFCAAHDLKGVALNLCFTKLGAAISVVVENLRNNNFYEAKRNMELSECIYKEILLAGDKCFANL